MKLIVVAEEHEDRNPKLVAQKLAYMGNLLPLKIECVVEEVPMYVNHGETPTMIFERWELDKKLDSYPKDY